jgi:hypothetical protein
MQLSEEMLKKLLRGEKGLASELQDEQQSSTEQQPQPVTPQPQSPPAIRPARPINDQEMDGDRPATTSGLTLAQAEAILARTTAKEHEALLACEHAIDGGGNLNEAHVRYNQLKNVRLGAEQVVAKLRAQSGQNTTGSNYQTQNMPQQVPVDMERLLNEINNPPVGGANVAPAVPRTRRGHLVREHSLEDVIQPAGTDSATVEKVAERGAAALAGAAKLLEGAEDKNLRKISPGTLMAVDYILKVIYNDNFDGEIDKLRKALPAEKTREISYIVDAAKLARTLKSKGASYVQVQGLFTTLVENSDKPGTMGFVKYVFDNNIDISYMRELLDFLNSNTPEQRTKALKVMNKIGAATKHTGIENIADFVKYAVEHNINLSYINELVGFLNDNTPEQRTLALGVMKKIGKSADYASTYAGAEELANIINSEHRKEILKLLRKLGELDTHELKDLEKIADGDADSASLKFAKDVGMRRNPNLSLPAYIALEHIVDSIIHNYRYTMFGLDNEDIECLKAQYQNVDSIKNAAHEYIDKIDDKLQTCTEGKYGALHSPKQGCNQCKERESGVGCIRRNTARNLKGLLRAVVAIVSDGKSDRPGDRDD